LRSETRTVANEVLAVAEAVDLLLEQALQPFLTLNQRQLGRAYAIQEQKIEGEEDKLIGAALIHGGWSRLKTGTPSPLTAHSSPSR
jgi:hypothetical protein